ncbi:MAG: glycosyltransferase [Desulfobacteraceae bacterium]
MKKTSDSYQDNLLHDSNILFSIIIPSYNEENHIGDCIKSIRTNNGKNFPYEIILVDDGSTDSTVSKVKDLGIQIIENKSEKKHNISALRNMGAKEAKGKIFAFLDADMTVPDNWLEKAWDYFLEGFEGALGFLDTVPQEAGWVGRVWGERFLYRRKSKEDVDFLQSRNIFINRQVFNKIGGFNESLLTSEDKDLTMRVLKAGFRAVSLPDIILIHHGYEKNFFEFIRKEFWRQNSTIQCVKENSFSIRSLKNPLVSSWHILFLIIFLVALFTQHIFFILSALILWILPSGLIVFLYSGTGKFPLRMASFFSLTFVRWNVAGVALVLQLIKKGIFNKK